VAISSIARNIFFYETVHLDIFAKYKISYFANYIIFRYFSYPLEGGEKNVEKFITRLFLGGFLSFY